MTIPWWLLAAAGLCLLIVARCAAHQKHPVRALIAGAVCGLGTLAVLALLEPATGVSLPFNRFTGFVATILGLPGVTALLILRLLL